MADSYNRYIVTSCRLNLYHSSLTYSVWLYLAGVGLECHVLYRCKGSSCHVLYRCEGSSYKTTGGRGKGDSPLELLEVGVVHVSVVSTVCRRFSARWRLLVVVPIWWRLHVPLRVVGPLPTDR